METIYRGEKQSLPIHSQKHWFHSRWPNPTSKTRLGGENNEFGCQNLAAAKGTELDRTFVFFPSEHLSDTQ